MPKGLFPPPRGQLWQKLVQQHDLQLSHSLQPSIVRDEDRRAGSERRGHLESIRRSDTISGPQIGSQLGHLQINLHDHQIGIGGEQLQVIPGCLHIPFPPGFQQDFQKGNDRDYTGVPAHLPGLQEQLGKRAIAGVILQVINKNHRIRSNPPMSTEKRL